MAGRRAHELLRVRDLRERHERDQHDGGARADHEEARERVWPKCLFANPHG
jgi:hypothetical protein